MVLLGFRGGSLGGSGWFWNGSFGDSGWFWGGFEARHGQATKLQTIFFPPVRWLTQTFHPLGPKGLKAP